MPETDKPEFFIYVFHLSGTELIVSIHSIESVFSDRIQSRFTGV